MTVHERLLIIPPESRQETAEAVKEQRFSLFQLRANVRHLKSIRANRGRSGPIKVNQGQTRSIRAIKVNQANQGQSGPIKVNQDQSNPIGPTNANLVKFSQYEAN